jgi:farnesyl-diphosphate farnesyltransferase
LSTPLVTDDNWAFCEATLPEVSRSFALIIPQCPPPIDRALCAAYLLCRVADTVEDEASLSESQRDGLYDAFLIAVDRPNDALLASRFRDLWPGGSDPAYDRLIAGVEHVLNVYAAFDEAIQRPIRTCVHDMIAGMRTVRKAEIVDDISFVCRDLADLDTYCHYVAGTVGLMSNALFETRFEPAVFEATDEWREQGRRLGLGLQMTNIIKDCRVDGQRGVSFIPAEYVDLSGRSYQLRRGTAGSLFRHTIDHLDAALAYIRAVPVSETGIRTFLLGSFLPAIATLEVAAAGTDFHPKIDREKMTEIFELIAGHVSNHERIARWYADHRQRTLDRL